MNYPEFDELSPGKPRLQWFTDTGAIPIRTSTVLPDTYERKHTSITAEFHCRLFRLQDEESRKLYCMIKQRICDGWYQLLKEHEAWPDNADGYPEIWLEWTQQYRTIIKS